MSNTLSSRSMFSHGNALSCENLRRHPQLGAQECPFVRKPPVAPPTWRTGMPFYAKTCGATPILAHKNTLLCENLRRHPQLGAQEYPFMRKVAVAIRLASAIANRSMQTGELFIWLPRCFVYHKLFGFRKYCG